MVVFSWLIQAEDIYPVAIQNHLWSYFSLELIVRGFFGDVISLVISSLEIILPQRHSRGKVTFIQCGFY